MITIAPFVHINRGYSDNLAFAVNMVNTIVDKNAEPVVSLVVNGSLIFIRQGIKLFLRENAVQAYRNAYRAFATINMRVTFAWAGITTSTNEATITANTLTELRTKRGVTGRANIAENIITYRSKIDWFDMLAFFFG